MARSQARRTEGKGEGREPWRGRERVGEAGVFMAPWVACKSIAVGDDKKNRRHRSDGGGLSGASYFTRSI
jgi:hypothetical protein